MTLMGRLCDAQNRYHGMIATIGFLIAVAAVSTVIFVLMTRADNVRLDRARSRGGSYDGTTDSWSLASWVGYTSSVDSTNGTDGSACTTGSWDSGSVSDCGSSSDSGGGSFSSSD
jgi:hypothetical protein